MGVVVDCVDVEAHHHQFQKNFTNDLFDDNVVVFTCQKTSNRQNFVIGGNSPQGFRSFHKQNRLGLPSVQEIPMLLTEKKTYIPDKYTKSKNCLVTY